MTDVKNLFFCDNIVMPRSGDIPPVLTLIALGKRFARKLLGAAAPKKKQPKNERKNRHE